MANPYQPQADKADYLMSVLCVIQVLDLLTLPLTAIIGIFWVKKYQLPFLGEGFSAKINVKKILQILLIAASGAALGWFAMRCEMSIPLYLERFFGTAIADDSSSIALSIFQSSLFLPLQLLVTAVSAFVSEFAFRRCLYGEWRKYGILPSIIGSGIITMLLSPILSWPGMLLLGICAALVYEVTRCLVMTSVFHIAFLWVICLKKYVVSAGILGLLLWVAVCVVLLLLALEMSPNWNQTRETVAVQQQNKQKHPYVFRASFNFFMVVLILFQTTPYWAGPFLG